MACLTDNQVAAFFAQGRSGKVAAQVDAHTAECERCRRLIAEYAHVSAAQTAPTHRDEGRRSGEIGASSLGAGKSSEEERAELVHRLAQANARKYVGAVIKGKWQIEELLGTGGMAHVFAARHRNGRRVAIKCMRPELMLERQFVQRFLREGYVANTIEHPGAVAVLDDDVMDDGTPFLVMELLVGRTLRQRLEESPLPLSEALDAIAQVLDLLAVAHEKGIVHRDLKPDNLFETESGAIKVLDFGIARLKERTRPEFETRSGTTMGTVGYMPPEQARGLTAQVDARSDVWAVGATLHALLTGRPVHEAATTNEALLLAMTTPVPPMSTVLPTLPPPVQAFLDTALAFDKDRRFPDARAMKLALEEAVREAGGAATLAVPIVRVPAPAAGAPAALVGAAATEVLPAQPSATLLDQAFTQPEDVRRPTPSRGRRVAAWGALGAVVAAAAVGVTMVRTSGSPWTAPAAAPSEPPTAVAATSGATAEPAVASTGGASTGGAMAEPALAATVVAAAPVDAGGPVAATSASGPPAATSSTPTSATSARGARPPARPKAPAPPRSPAAATGTAAPAPVDTRDPLGPRN